MNTRAIIVRWVIVLTFVVGMLALSGCATGPFPPFPDNDSWVYPWTTF